MLVSELTVIYIYILFIEEYHAVCGPCDIYIPHPAAANSARNSAKKRNKREITEKKWIGAEGETIHLNPGK